MTRVAREVGTEGKLGGQADVRGVAGTWKDLTDSVNYMASNLTNQVRNIAGVTTAVARGDLDDENHGGRARRNSGAEEHHQHDGRSAQLFRIGSHARGARSRNRRKARRTGGSARRRRNLEGSDRQRQLHGRQPDQSGPQHRRSDHRGGTRRSVAQNYGRRARRNSGAEEHHQHHGRSAQLVRLGSHARRARSGNRRQARRPGRCARRRGHVEGS